MEEDPPPLEVLVDLSCFINYLQDMLQKSLPRTFWQTLEHVLLWIPEHVQRRLNQIHCRINLWYRRVYFNTKSKRLFPYENFLFLLLSPKILTFAVKCRLLEGKKVG